MRLLPEPGPSRTLALSTLINTVGRGTWLTASALFLTRSVGLTVTQVGLALTITALVSLVTSTPMGYLADRLGPRGLQLAALVASAGFTAALVAVRSFAGFLVVGVLGWAWIGRIASPPLATHYRVLCTAIALVAFGSGWYHVAPSNASLMWDRLPMTVAFMALFAAVLADRISWVLGRALLWPLVVAGIASIAWWVRTEAAGAGDLRAYALVQFLPLMLIPLILLLWRQGSLAARPLWLAIAAYAVAKLVEHFDGAIFAATGLVGGHPLKHLAAALATWWAVRAFHGAPARAL